MQSIDFAPAPGRFLHLVHDEKFIDAARGIFEEAAPAAHDFVIVGGHAPLRHIHTFEPARLELGEVLDRRFLAALPRYSAVFVHYLGEAARLIVDAAPRPARFVWLGWGADYYHLIRPQAELLLPRTRDLVRELARHATAPTPSAGAAWLQHAGGVLRAAAGPLAAARRIQRRRAARRIGQHAPGEPALLNRFHAVAMPIQEDFAAVCARHPGFGVPFLDWNYWTEGFRAADAPGAPTGNDILLGNSATPASNHLEALAVLADILPPDRRVICPLSYGDPSYGDAIESAGRRLLGERFVPLREFMDSAAYAQVLGRCSIVVMNHVRQQGLGNILLALSGGATVFLNAENPIHASMRRIGVQVRDLEQLPAFLREGEPRVPAATLDEIRSRLEARYGRASILGRTRELLQRLAGCAEA